MTTPIHSFDDETDDDNVIGAHLHDRHDNDDHGSILFVNGNPTSIPGMQKIAIDLVTSAPGSHQTSVPDSSAAGLPPTFLLSNSEMRDLFHEAGKAGWKLEMPVPANQVMTAFIPTGSLSTASAFFITENNTAMANLFKH